ncbi:MAG: hypothetical protein ABIO60_06460 [Aquaticitalea sp.]
MSSFKSDLEQEHLLALYLDGIYTSKNLTFERIQDIDLQHCGIDVIFHKNSQHYFIDEKAQLHYLNQDLPTFTFELSYLNKNGKINQGWLFDDNKKTNYYFLITGIFLKENIQSFISPEDIKKLKITSINRKKLIRHLETIGLSKSKLIAYDLDLRTNETFGKNPIAEFRNPKNGCLFFTEHLSEKPINLQLRLDHLIENQIGKRFYCP